MLRKAICVSAALAACAGAWAMDFETSAPAGNDYYRLPDAPPDGPTMELSWDNGTRMYFVAWTGTGGGRNAVGNDFDVSTLKTHNARIATFKFLTSDVWPNGTWDGFLISFYRLSGGTPGEILWPSYGNGYFFQPSGVQGHVWAECPIDWVCPASAFVAVQGQCYDYPDCDPFAVDNNRVCAGHSWEYAGGYWNGLSITPYRNLMLRVSVEMATTMVSPSSLGRVKALYY